MTPDVWRQRQRRVSATQQRLARSVEDWSTGLVRVLETTDLLDRSWRGSVPDLLRSFGVLLDHRLFDFQEAMGLREQQQREVWQLRRERDARLEELYEIAKRHRGVVRGLVGSGIERWLCGEGRTPRSAVGLMRWVESYLHRLGSTDVRKILEDTQKSAFDWDQLAPEIEPPLARLGQTVRDLKLAEQQETEAVWQRRLALAALDVMQNAVDCILEGVSLLVEE